MRTYRLSNNRISWDENLIRSELSTIIDDLGLDYFPSRKEIRDYFGNQKLTNALDDFGGSAYWAQYFHLPIKMSDTFLGNTYELLAVDNIKENTGLIAEKMTSRFPYDILVDRSVKVDVKVSRPQHKCVGDHMGWTFNLEKKNQTCDIYIAYCIDDDSDIIKRLIIPSTVLSARSQFGVGEESKWDIYKNDWGIIIQFADFFKGYKEQPRELGFVQSRYN